MNKNCGVPRLASPTVYWAPLDKPAAPPNWRLHWCPAANQHRQRPVPIFPAYPHIEGMSNPAGAGRCQLTWRVLTWWVDREAFNRRTQLDLTPDMFPAGPGPSSAPAESWDPPGPNAGHVPGVGGRGRPPSVQSSDPPACAQGRGGGGGGGGMRGKAAGAQSACFPLAGLSSDGPSCGTPSAGSGAGLD